MIPYEKNPRILTEKQKEELTESIRKFDLAEIPAINTDGKIVAGHQRIMVLQLLGRGEETIDVRIPSRKLTPDEFREYLLRSNKNTGEWNYEMLKDFDIEQLMDVGFGDEELSGIWDGATGIEEDGFNAEKEAGKIKIPKTKNGEVYKLGPHRLMCGDSTKEKDVKKLMGKDLADMVYCDPPYNIGLDYSKGIGTAGKYKCARIKSNDKFPDLKYKGFRVNDKKKIGEYSDFLNSTIKNALKFSKPNIHFFYWCDENYIWLLQTLFSQNEIMLRRVNLWVKNNANVTPQVAFNKVYEPCVYGTKGTPYLNKNYANLNEILNQEIESGNQVQDEILDIINIWLAKRDNAQSYQHPTQKPLNLHEKPIKRCTKPRDLIIDLFGGSGSTLISAEQLKRKAYLMEQDPIFCDVIIKRFEQFTNQKAKKIS